MTNFEKIDDYLSNRLSESERSAFENQLAGDPALKEEFVIQQQVVKGVQQARIAELKNMLSQVPVGGSGFGASQIAATALSVGVVLFGLYYFMQPDEPQAVQPEPIPSVIIEPVKPADAAPAADTESAVKAEVNAEVTKEPTTREPRLSRPVQKPAIQVVDPSAEFRETEEPVGVTAPERTEIRVSKLEVITESSDKKHSLHYNFSQGKLLLYGPFDSNLYEILEIHGESHAVFLYYKENYYLLDETQEAITGLQAIRDGKLLQKLREYRGR
ncbi:MAG: hypothetical protein SH819_09770 [Cytophagales bacterium]|nr:hypothetical protein [Cytophagales bacterium]